MYARLRMGFPHGHRKTTTLVAGLRLRGMVAPKVLDGPINGDWFETYVRHVLAPTLKPGDIVIMDNLTSHKRTDRGRRRLDALPSALQPRPKPHRDGLLNARGAPAKEPPSEPSKAYGKLSDASSISLHPQRAPTSSPQQTMNQNERETL
jgi:hypothetical protein